MTEIKSRNISWNAGEKLRFFVSETSSIACWHLIIPVFFCLSFSSKMQFRVFSFKKMLLWSEECTFCNERNKKHLTWISTKVIYHKSFLNNCNRQMLLGLKWPERHCWNVIYGYRCKNLAQLKRRKITFSDIKHEFSWNELCLSCWLKKRLEFVPVLRIGLWLASGLAWISFKEMWTLNISSCAETCNWWWGKMFSQWALTLEPF